MQNALILIVEDETEISQIIAAYLRRDGFRTICAADGETALGHHRDLRPDLIILDIGLPKRDGMELLAEIRRRGSTPVIMATARTEDLDKLLALRMGADDYVVKPFNPQELVERAKAVLRRTKGDIDSVAMLRGADLEIDSASHLVWATNKGLRRQIDTTLSEYRLLEHMIASPGRVFTRAELLDASLPDSDAMDRTVDSHISHLRKKLQQVGLEGYLEAVRGVGYRLEPASCQ
jgi:two-component system response regulator AdeR